MPTRVCARCTAAFRVRACVRWQAASRFSRCCVCWGVSAALGAASAAGTPPRRSHAHRTATHAPSWARLQSQSTLALSSPRGRPPLQRPARSLGAAPEPERRDVATGAPVLAQSRGLHSPPPPSTPPHPSPCVWPCRRGGHHCDHRCVRRTLLRCSLAAGRGDRDLALRDRLAPARSRWRWRSRWQWPRLVRRRVHGPARVLPRPRRRGVRGAGRVHPWPAPR